MVDSWWVHGELTWVHGRNGLQIQKELNHATPMLFGSLHTRIFSVLMDRPDMETSRKCDSQETFHWDEACYDDGKLDTKDEEYIVYSGHTF